MLKIFLKITEFFMMSVIAALTFGGVGKLMTTSEINKYLFSKFLKIIKKLGGKIN